MGGERARPGYMPQDPQAEFADKIDLFTWMSQYTGKADDDQLVRATLGSAAVLRARRPRNRCSVLSGGEKGRMIYGKLMLTRPNVLLMDEPTNHMDMETIESLQIGLEKLSRHAVIRFARPRVRGRPRDAHHRTEARRPDRRLQGQLRRVPQLPGYCDLASCSPLVADDTCGTIATVMRVTAPSRAPPPTSRRATENDRGGRGSMARTGA